MSKRLIFVFILMIILFNASCAQAVEMGISPPDIHLTLSQGQTYQGEVTVFGSDREPVAVNVYPMDWALTSAGDYQFLPAGILKRSLSPWLSYPVRNFILPPGMGQKVTYTLQVPDDAAGSYWGVIMFGSVPKPAPGKDRVQIAMTGRMAYLIRVDVNSPSGAGSIERFKLSWNKSQRKLSAALRVKNSGAAFLYLKSYLELRNLEGKKVGLVPFNNGLVLPDYSREFHLEEANLSLEPGTYIGLAVVDTGARNLKAVQATVEMK